MSGLLKLLGKEIDASAGKSSENAAEIVRKMESKTEGPDPYPTHTRPIPDLYQTPTDQTPLKKNAGAHVLQGLPGGTRPIPDLYPTHTRPGPDQTRPIPDPDQTRPIPDPDQTYTIPIPDPLAINKEEVDAIGVNKRRFLELCIRFLYEQPEHTVSTKSLAEELELSINTVKKYIRTMGDTGYFGRKTIRNGTAQGLRITWVKPSILAWLAPDKTYTRPDPDQTHTRPIPDLYQTPPLGPDPYQTPHHYKRKIDRIYLLFRARAREEYPNLVKYGFGEKQIRQVYEERIQENIPTDDMLEELEYLEAWAGKKEVMDEKAKPLSWLYSSFRKGVFRPDGFLTAREKYLQVLKKRKEHRAKMEKQIREMEAEEWFDGLDEATREKIIRGQVGTDKKRWIEQCYGKKERWEC
ncbi:MAG: HTH domain-containing protein [Sphaerochaetaceae bacterium]